MPPSEHVMATWLHPIVSGQDPAAADNVLKVTAESSKGKLPMTDVMFTDPNSSEKKKASGGSSSRNVLSAKHNMTEKKRRCKIAARIRTLQQLVPGCDHRSSQASTLDQTIQYMRWLQQQVQSASTSWQAPPASATAAAAHPVTQTPTAAAVAMPMPPAATFRPGVVPMDSYRRYHALMMSSAAPAAPLYPAPAQVGASAAAPDAIGHHAHCSVSTEQQQHQHKD